MTASSAVAASQRRWTLRPADLVLIGWFSANTARLLVDPIRNGFIGWDAVVYAHAARALIEGSDPWRTLTLGIVYAAPPPSLLFSLPIAYVPDPIVAAGFIALAAASAIYAIRALHLPWWWLLFPPIALGIISGSTALPVIALLIRGGVVADAVAVLMRIYAAIPLLLEGRIKGLLLALAVFAVTAPFLEWGTYAGDRDFIAYVLQGQSSNLSAFSAPLLIPVAIVCLVLLGRRRAAWLAVPALWPYTNVYYAVIALPVLAELPVAAFFLAGPPVAGAVVVGLVGEVARGLLGSRRRSV